MESQTISQAMIEEHARLHEILEEIKSKIENLDNDKKSEYNDLLKIFNKFKWNTEKHFFVEEKIIISTYLSFENNSSNEDVQHILNDHKEIIKFIDEIEESLREGIKPDITDLVDLLDEHEQNEENYFYPKLDEELDEECKKVIISKSKEIVF